MRGPCVGCAHVCVRGGRRRNLSVMTNVSSGRELSHEVHPNRSLPLEGELNCYHFFTFKRRRPEGMKEAASSSALPLVVKHI